MISEKNIKDQNLNLLHEDLLSYLTALSPQQLKDSFTDFYLSQDKVELSQSVDLQSEVMYEGDKAPLLDFNMPTNEAVKAELAEPDHGSAVPPQEVLQLSRQSSLGEDWFGNISYTCPNDVSFDSSLESMFAFTGWQDFNEDVPTTTDAGAAMAVNVMPDSSVIYPASCQYVDSISAEETSAACQSLPQSSTVCKPEPQSVVVPNNIRENPSQSTEGVLFI